MLRLRFFRKDTSFPSIETDQYEEHGSFIESEFKVVRNEKDKTSALLELVNDGTVKVPASNEEYPCCIRKLIIVEDSQIKIKINGKFKEIPGKEALLDKLIDNLTIGVDFPFFFNGEPSKFQWESDNVSIQNNEKNPLVKSLEITANEFKAYDESYELNLNYSFESHSKIDTTSIKIFKFPINAFVFTDEGYKKIYQGVNLLPKFKLGKKFELKAIIAIA